MNQQPSSKKSMLIVIIIIVLAAIGYFYYSGTKSGDSETMAVSNTEDEAIGARVMLLLNQIRSLQIDTSVFKGAAYQTLRDFTVQIPPEEVGRQNPFAPVPGLRSSGQSGR